MDFCSVNCLFTYFRSPDTPSSCLKKIMPFSLEHFNIGPSSSLVVSIVLMTSQSSLSLKLFRRSSNVFITFYDIFTSFYWRAFMVYIHAFAAFNDVFTTSMILLVLYWRFCYVKWRFMILLRRLLTLLRRRLMTLLRRFRTFAEVLRLSAHSLLRLKQSLLLLFFLISPSASRLTSWIRFEKPDFLITNIES